MTDLKEKHVVVVGGGSGIGRAVATAAREAGARVTISSRDRAKLDRAAAEIGAAVAPVDMTDADAVAAWAEGLGPIDHLIVSASSAARGPFAELDISAVKAMFDAKFFGPYAVAKAALPKMREGGSITFFSGVLSRRPGTGASGLAAVNAAVEGLSRALAKELGPKLRVNTISPGLTRSDAYAAMPEDARAKMYADVGAALPVGRVGEVEDVAAATLALATNGFVTGVVFDVDGGHMVG
ncbi:MAG: SDR family oxidoreductase [Pseudomonadota bacterium]